MCCRTDVFWSSPSLINEETPRAFESGTWARSTALYSESPKRSRNVLSAAVVPASGNTNFFAFARTKTSGSIRRIRKLGKMTRRLLLPARPARTGPGRAGVWCCFRGRGLPGPHAAHCVPGFCFERFVGRPNQSLPDFMRLNPKVGVTKWVV